MNKTFLSITAIIAAVAMIGSIGAFTSSAHAAAPCSGNSGNPHQSDPDDIIKTNPQGKSVGNPHDIDEGQTHGNPHCQV